MRDSFGNLVPPSEQETQRALKLPRRKPDDSDRPPLSVFPGPKRKPLPGQLDFENDGKQR